MFEKLLQPGGLCLAPIFAFNQSYLMLGQQRQQLFIEDLILPVHQLVRAFSDVIQLLSRRQTFRPGECGTGFETFF